MRPPSNSAERVAYRSPSRRFEGFLSAAIDGVLPQIVVTSQRPATAISSAERANCEPAEEAFMTSGAPPHGFPDGEANYLFTRICFCLRTRPWPECADFEKPILFNKFDYPYFPVGIQ
jgi:hypothetical protein